MLLFKGNTIHRATIILGWDMGIGAPGQGVGSHAKNLAESTNREFRRLGLEISQGAVRVGRGRGAISSSGKEKSSTLFLMPFKPIHSSLKQ